MSGEHDRSRNGSPLRDAAFLAVLLTLALIPGQAPDSTAGDPDPPAGTPRADILPPNQEPFARITTDPAGPAPTGTRVTISAADSADPEGQPLRYRFDLDGDGTFERDTDGKPQTTTTYERPGVYNVAVEVLDPVGATAASETTVTATNRPPGAVLAASTLTPAPRHTVGFDAGASSDPEGTRLTYTWDLDGDGTYETRTGEGPHALASYPPHAAPIVRVTATDADGGSAAAAVVVSVRDQQPSAKLSLPAERVGTGERIVLSAGESSDPDGDQLTYEWDLDGDGTYEVPASAEPRLGTSFAKAGQRKVRVRVSDGFGQSDGATAKLTVTSAAAVGHPPTVAIGAPSRVGPPGRPVTLTAAGADPDGGALTYRWSLGRLPAMGPVDQRQVTTVYPSTKPSLVTVMVADDHGNTATDSFQLAAWPRAGIAARRRPVAKGRRLLVPVTCPAAADTPCRGTIRIAAAVQPRRWHGHPPRMAGQRLVTAPVAFKVKPGGTITVGGWLNPGASRLMLRRSRVPAVVTIAAASGGLTAFETLVARR